MRDFITPFVTILVGAATGVYIFQPLVLEQLKRDNNLNPKYDTDEKVVESVLGDLTNDGKAPNPPTDASRKQE